MAPNMKSFLLSLAAVAPIAQASSLVSRATCDTANDWDGEDGSSCADVAAIFARGTFDSGNIGVWVGCPFREALEAKFGSGKVAFQGVSPDDYPADLDDYLRSGAPDSCASSLGKAVEAYAAVCPQTKFVISGWSQGALCAHKSLNDSFALTNTAARDNVLALTTFGDPMTVWEDSISFPAVPAKASDLTYCEDNPTDPLCGDVDLDWPSNPVEFIAKLKSVWNEASSINMNDDQKAALADLVVELPSQAADEITKLGEDIFSGHIKHWLLTPQHFWYGLGSGNATWLAAEEIYAAYSS